MSYRTEFPDYDGEFFIPEGFKDVSYANDVAPSCEKVLPNGNIIVLFQDYEDPAKREYPTDDRYAVLILDEEGNEISSTPEGNSLLDVLIMLNGYIQEVNDYGTAEWISVKER